MQNPTPLQTMLENLAAGLGTSVLYDSGKALLTAASKTEFVQRVLAELGMQAAEHDFSKRYVEALVELRLAGKPKAVLELFRDKRIMQAFYDYYYGPAAARGDDKAHATALNQCPAFLREAYPATPTDVDILAEVEAFWQAFRKKVQESRTVKEAEVNQKLDELKGSAANTEELLQGLQAWLQAREAEQVEWRGRMETVPKGGLPEVLREEVVQIVGSKNVVAHSQITAEKVHIGDIIYGDRKIPRALTQNPFQSEVFIGREEELRAVHDKLFAPEGNLLLLMNGEGGVGKTTLAARYYAQYQPAYQHTAWVLCEPDMAAALLQLAAPLGLSFPEQMRSEQRLERLLTAMAGLKRPCLLVVDNANELPDLERHYQQLRRCSNFHLLLTTRITAFERAACHQVKGLPEPQALDLFRSHYPKLKPEEEALVRQIRTAVGGNTLVLELLAKTLAQANRLKTSYTLAELLASLQSQGLLSVTYPKAVATDYQSRGKMRREPPEAIIRAMYDLSGLGKEAQALLSVFAVLPAERIAFDALEGLLPNFPELDGHLLALAQSGWLDYNETAADFKCSPVVQAIAKEKNQARLAGDGARMVAVLNEKLKYQPGVGHFLNVTYDEARIFARYGEAVVAGLGTPSRVLRILCERIGNYHAVMGDLGSALTYYEQYARIAQALYASDSGNADFKHGLAISYEKLGQIHSMLGDLQQALVFFEKYNQLEKELYEAELQNVDFKNGLAASYANLGDTHSKQNDLLKALEFYEEFHQLMKELHDADPQNMDFKNRLAASYAYLGETYSMQDNLQKALEFYEKFNQLGEELCKTHPQNMGFKENLGWSYQFLGITYASSNDFEQALAFYERMILTFAVLHETCPQHVRFKNGLAISYANLAQFHRDHTKDLSQAKAHFQQAEQLWAELVRDAPQYAEFQRFLAQVREEEMGLGA